MLENITSIELLVLTMKSKEEQVEGALQLLINSKLITSDGVPGFVFRAEFLVIVGRRFRESSPESLYGLQSLFAVKDHLHQGRQTQCQKRIYGFLPLRAAVHDRDEGRET